MSVCRMVHSFYRQQGADFSWHLPHPLNFGILAKCYCLEQSYSMRFLVLWIMHASQIATVKHSAPSCLIWV